MQTRDSVEGLNNFRELSQKENSWWHGDIKCRGKTDEVNLIERFLKRVGNHSKYRQYSESIIKTRSENTRSWRESAKVKVEQNIVICQLREDQLFAESEGWSK